MNLIGNYEFTGINLIIMIIIIVSTVTNNKVGHENSVYRISLAIMLIFAVIQMIFYEVSSNSTVESKLMSMASFFIFTVNCMIAFVAM